MKLMRIQLYGAFAFLFAACSSVPVTDTSLVTESHKLIQVQNKLIDEQSERLDLLADSQGDMSEQIALVQMQVDRMSGTLYSVLKNTQPKADEKQAKSKMPSVESTQSTAANTFDGKAILGRVEYVWLDETQEYVKARIDTGAKSSFLHAKNVQPFERNGDPWVRFDMLIEEKTITMEAPLVRWVRVRQASDSDSGRRAVVGLTVNMGELREETEFMLTDRKDMLYPMLLGRSFLQDIAIVDVAKKFTRSRDPKHMAQVDQ